MAKEQITPFGNNAGYNNLFTQHYDADFIFYNDLNYTDASDTNDLPPAVFLSIMQGSKILHQFDWGSIYDAKEVEFILNQALFINQP
jgi:hypothetical protein